MAQLTGVYPTLVIVLVTIEKTYLEDTPIHLSINDKASVNAPSQLYSNVSLREPVEIQLESAYYTEQAPIESSPELAPFQGADISERASHTEEDLDSVPLWQGRVSVGSRRSAFVSSLLPL